MTHSSGTVAQISAVVCTLNSAASIRACLESLRAAGVGQLIVVDAGSTDGTREIAGEVADLLLDDPGIGLGNARNIGIARTTGSFILNMGSDNVMPEGQLEMMLGDLRATGSSGVSAQTVISGDDYVSRGLNAWRRGRFPAGPAAIIGTPTLFVGDLLRAHPYDPTRRFSDDSELCERWARELGARFAISSAYVLEQGKATWPEVATRCRMYGISDEEIFRRGSAEGWPASRRVRSLLHPLRVDLVEPITRLDPPNAIISAPFLIAFTAMRYGAWLNAAATRAAREPRR